MIWRSRGATMAHPVRHNNNNNNHNNNNHNNNNIRKERVVIKKVPYWTVEEIRGVRVNDRGTLEYLVHWVGFPVVASSWEPEKNCRNAAKRIEEFYSRMPVPDRDYFMARRTIIREKHQRKPEVPKRSLRSANFSIRDRLRQRRRNIAK